MKRTERQGFTLLEIILALAILAGALAALGEVMRLGDQNSSLTRDETQAQILASSVMDELMAGARPPTAVNSAAFDLKTEPPWIYSIEITPTQQHAELLAIRVRVEQQLLPEQEPARYDLVRWVLNPDYVTSLQTSAQAMAASSASSGSSSGGSGAGGSGGQGGTGGSGGRQ